MALEYSMYPQLMTGISISVEELSSASGRYFGYYDSVGLQTLATALGDGFYVDEITLTNDLSNVRWFISSNNTGLYAILSGKTISVLRNQRYNNLGLFFATYTTTNSTSDVYRTGALVLNVIDVSTETVVCNYALRQGYGNMSTSGAESAKLYIANTSAKVKMITGGTLEQYICGYFILCEDCIVLYGTTGSSGSSSNFPIYCVTNNGELLSTMFFPTLPSKSHLSLIPYYVEDLPNKEFKGIYYAERLTTPKAKYNFSKDGRLYYTSGFMDMYSVGGGVLAISDEVQEVTQ